MNQNLMKVVAVFVLVWLSYWIYYLVNNLNLQDNFSLDNTNMEEIILPETESENNALIQTDLVEENSGELEIEEVSTNTNSTSSESIITQESLVVEQEENSTYNLEPENQEQTSTPQPTQKYTNDDLLEYFNKIVWMLNAETNKYETYLNKVPSVEIEQAQALVYDLVSNIDSAISQIENIPCFYDNCDLRDSAISYLQVTKWIYLDEELPWLNSYYYKSEWEFNKDTQDLTASYSSAYGIFTQAQQRFTTQMRLEE